MDKCSEKMVFNTMVISSIEDSSFCIFNRLRCRNSIIVSLDYKLSLHIFYSIMYLYENKPI